ncbi:hypothetical protein FF124_12270 [Martelella lutilitoris]|uniref:Uncharacterized protein n=1 Tax=Martelella lutilitoris TaxID=2583532 RepID=A0A5C4JQY4_9HYPH|nr:hypothetical protein [Martelella lutilitoris]TNB47622.1 hypothetical protein FF124_12270 [Martelella lutilitoris]
MSEARHLPFAAVKADAAAVDRNVDRLEARQEMFERTRLRRIEIDRAYAVWRNAARTGRKRIGPAWSASCVNAARVDLNFD